MFCRTLAGCKNTVLPRVEASIQPGWFVTWRNSSVLGSSSTVGATASWPSSDCALAQAAFPSATSPSSRWVVSSVHPAPAMLLPSIAGRGNASDGAREVETENLRIAVAFSRHLIGARLAQAHAVPIASAFNLQGRRPKRSIHTSRCASGSSPAPGPRRSESCWPRAQPARLGRSPQAARRGRSRSAWSHG